MGRLFWKFFLFFFFAQLATALGVGAFVQFNANKAAARGYIDQSPFAQSLLDAAESTLKLGGTSALKPLLESWDAQQLMHSVYVMNESNQEVLNREIQPSWLIEVEQHSSQLFDSATRVVQAPNGEQYTLFAVFSSQLPFSGMQHRMPPEHDMALRPPHDFAPPPHDFRPPPKPRDNPRPIIGAVKAFPLKALLIAALASAVFAALLAWYFSKPINALRGAFKQAAEGDLNVRVANKMGSSKDELSDLGQHFDHMASRLSALLQGQKRLLHHVSHEMRSPLARLHMALGLARQDEAKTAASLDRIELEANRMDKLISELLELSRFETGMVALDKAAFSLQDVLERIVEDANFEATSKSVEIGLVLTTDIMLIAQQDLIYRAVENLVRNAVKYSPEGTSVLIKAQPDQAAQYCVIAVSDQGEGVLETELEDIFKPFVRGHSGSQVKGHGVGLAIAKQIIEAHSGSIVAENLSPYGFRVTVKLPIAS